jgi:DNA-binding MarR family transcriptional regulator
MGSFEESRTRHSPRQLSVRRTPVSDCIRLRSQIYREIDSAIASSPRDKLNRSHASIASQPNLLISWDDRKLPPFDENELRDPRLLMSAATEMYRMRRARDQLMPAGLMGEPAWDILLALYSEEPTALTVSSVCHGSGVSSAAGLRWIAVLEAENLVKRTAHERDDRIALVSMTEHGRSIVERCLRAMLRSARE